MSKHLRNNIVLNPAEAEAMSSNLTKRVIFRYNKPYATTRLNPPSTSNGNMPQTLCHHCSSFE